MNPHLLYHAHSKNSKIPQYTILFYYNNEERKLFTTWAKPNKKIDKFSKSVGRSICFERMKKLIEYVSSNNNEIEYWNLNDSICKTMKKSIPYYLMKCKRYFKIIDKVDIYFRFKDRNEYQILKDSF